MIGALLRSRLRMTWRAWTLRPARGAWPRHPGVAIGLGLVMALLVHAGLAQGFEALGDDGGGAAARAGLLAIALSGALVALLAFDVDDVVRSLVLDPDLELLRRAPLAPAVVLAIKGLDAAPRTLLPVLVLAAPAVAAFLAGTPHPLAGGLVATVALLMLWIATLAAGVAVALLLLRVMPVRWAREALSLVSTLVLTILWVVGALVLPRTLALQDPGGSGLAALLERAGAGIGPAAAAARAIASAGTGSAPDALAPLAMLAGAAVVSVGLAGLTARSALAPVLDRVAGAGAREPAGDPDRPFRWRPAGPTRAILRRDGRLLRRSWTVMSDVVVASALWGLLPLATLAGGGAPGPELVRLVLLSLAIGLGYEVAARSIPFERHAGFWARVTPVGPGRYLFAKVSAAGLVSIPVVTGVALLLLVTRQVSAGQLASMAGVVGGALLLSQAFGAWAGATFGDPEWVNPRAMLRFGGRLVASLLVVGQLAAWSLAGYGTEWLAASIGVPLSAGIPILAAAILAALPIRAAARRLASGDSPN